MLSEESLVIRQGLGEFLQELAFVDRRWIRIDSCANKTFKKPITGGETKEVDCPLESFSDLLGISANKAHEYLCAAKLMVQNNYHKTFGPNKNGWDALKSEHGLDIEIERASDVHHLGGRMHLMRIGCLCNDNPKTFTAKDQAKSFFTTGWKPKRLRATRQANAFLAKTALDLTIFMVKQRVEKELEERKKEVEYDGDDNDVSDDDEDDESFSLTSSNDDNESLQAYATPSKSTLINFDMKEAKSGPIQWTSPNGTPQTAVCIPRTGTRNSFRKSAKKTNWIAQVTESMFNTDRVLSDVGLEWFIEAIYERHRPQFESFCVRKGYMLPTTARMPKGKSAAMWTDGNVSYKVQRIINQHCYEHFRRWIFAKEEDVRGFGETAMTPTIGVSTNEKGQHIFYWWKPPDDMLLHEINNMINANNIHKLASVDFSTGGDHGKGRFRQMLTVALRFKDGEPDIIERFIIGEIDSAKDSTDILKATFLVDLNKRLKLLASGEFVITRGEKAGTYGLMFSSDAPGLSTDRIVVTVKSRIFVCGDAKFYMQVLGREHSAPHWCVWCSINVRQFDFRHYPSDVSFWTLKSMKSKREKGLSGPACQGVYSEPLFNFCEPSNFLPNVLHEKINTGNDVIAAIYRFTDRRVESVTQEESNARSEALAAEIALIECKECIQVYRFACQALSISVAEAREKSGAGQISLEEQEQLEEDEGELETLENEIFEYQEVIHPYAKKEYAEKKKAFEKLWKEKDRGGYQVRNYIDNKIFQKHKMRTQAYHGGEKYTGVDIGILTGNANIIVGEIEEYLLEIVHPLKEASDGEIRDFCNHIKRVLNMLDGMFTILRKKRGEVEAADLVTYEQSAEQAALLWKKLGLSYTPSFHYVHKEALRLLRMHGGIGELLEDHLEKSHQKMERIHQRLARLGFGMKRAMAISRLAEMESNPELKDIKEKVRDERKRKFKRTSKGAKQMARKKVKTNCRARNLEGEIEKVKDETIVTGHEAAKRDSLVRS
jgi:hypothetical protein